MTEFAKRPRTWLVRTLLAILFVLVILRVGFAVWLYRLHDRNNQPLCNKQTFFEVMNWFDNKDRMDLPNVDGHSTDSLIKLKKDAYDPEDAEKEIEGWNEKYQYVPGLRRGDAGDLVLMYMKKPTRWIHHATSPPSIFREKKWIVVSLDFADHWSGWVTRVPRQIVDPSEHAERVSIDEFKSRLKKTLQFLRENNRPHWQMVLAENEEFLRKLDHE